MYVGQSIKRREDNKYLTGTGQFVDDVALSENIAHAAYVRSPHPHARIVGISTERALAMPGVMAVLTGKDWTDSGYGEAESVWPVKDMSGEPARAGHGTRCCGDGGIHSAGGGGGGSGEPAAQRSPGSAAAPR